MIELTKCCCCCCLSYFLDRNIQIESINPCNFNLVRISSELENSWFFLHPMQVKICSGAVCYVVFWTGRKDFISKHVELNTWASTTEPSKGRLNESAVFINLRRTRSVTIIPLMNGGYPSQGIDILFGKKSNFRESKKTIAISIFHTAFSS